MRWWRRGVLSGALALAAAGGAPDAVRAQELADFDYENLSFRGLGVEGSWIVPNQVEPTWALTVRADLGYLGPGLRLVPWMSYWSSRLQDDEVAALERSVEGFIDRETPGDPVTVDLGTIDRSDLAMGLDAHVVWAVPWGFLTYAGAGAAAHFLNGGGAAIDGTFVEDLMDSVTAGFNLHAGLEYPWQRVRLYGGARYELLDDIQYLGLGLGVQFMTGPSLPDEQAIRSGSRP